MVERWEYKILFVPTFVSPWSRPPTDINEQFDQLGAEGWELVGSEPVLAPAIFFCSAQKLGYSAFFKRRTSA